MGILNITPDSFSDGGQLCRNGRADVSAIQYKAEQMAAEGADIIDIGAESTRPGASPVSVQEELARLLPALEAVRSVSNLPISVDTSSPEVMSATVQAGAAMINDVRALTRPGALKAVAALDVPVCLMHMLREPGEMQQNPEYRDVVAEVITFLQQRISACLAASIHKDRILLDPGFGFGKTLSHNLALFRALPKIAELGFPLMVGVSRKSMVGAILNKPVAQRVHGSVALALLAVQREAKIIRVHDVGPTVDALKMLQALENIED